MLMLLIKKAFTFIIFALQAFNWRKLRDGLFFKNVDK